MKFVDKLLQIAGSKSASKSSTSDRRVANVSAPLARAAQYRVAAGRETIEAFVVAFILALLFRAFLAEVFVIPTGSMAPTLMGAHKDLFCQQCSCRFEVGASQESGDGSGAKVVVVGGVCPNCHRLNSLDLAGDSDQKTFNGDRIVVNKYIYAVSDPKRWDVIVFKFPGNPKQNYIKRLVGLPNETITLDHGNVYAQPSADPEEDGTDQTPREILRKPASKMLAMSHLVYDTDFQSPALIAANYPPRWQAWQPNATEPPANSWKIQRSNDSFAADLSIAEENKNSGSAKWLRYFHRWPNESQWNTAMSGGSLANVDPYQSRAVTDFYAYNSAVDVLSYEVYENPIAQPAKPRSLAGQVVQSVKGLMTSLTSREFNPKYKSGGPITQFSNPNVDPTDDSASHGIRGGLHWVGELMVTTEVSLKSSSRSKNASLTVEIVKAGVQYQCVINLDDGVAKLQVVDGEDVIHWDNDAPIAKTSMRIGSTSEIRLANYDHMMRLWIDGDEVEFDKPTRFDETAWRARQDDRPHWTPSHPLDASPVGIAVEGCDASINHLRIDRDQYYIATRTGTMEGNTEYDTTQVWRWSTGNYRDLIADRMGEPKQWADSGFWNARQTQTYAMQSDQFFPLGDNSPGSLDARSWSGKKRKLPLPREVIEDAWRWHDVHYVPRDLMVGKAVFILWPHPWTKPVPLTPGFDQIEMIR